MPDIQETKRFESTVKILPPPHWSYQGGANKVALRKHWPPTLFIPVYALLVRIIPYNAVWHEIKTCFQTFRIVFHPNIMDDVFNTLSNLFLRFINHYQPLSIIINHYQPLSTIINHNQP